jgi:hypothetical protein
VDLSSDPDKGKQGIVQISASLRISSGNNVIKLASSVIYEFFYQARVFVKLSWKSLRGRDTLDYYEKS